MEDLKIYNNGEGKILFSAGDRIIRQPYEFGKTHDITSDNSGYATNYLRCKSPINNISDGDFSIMMFCRRQRVDNNSRGVLRFESASFICALGIGYRAFHGEGIQLDYNKPSETTSGTSTTTWGYGAATSEVSFTFESFVFSNNLCKSYRGSIRGGVLAAAIASSTIPFTPEAYQHLSFARGQRGLHSFEYPAASIKINRLLLFNREVSRSESEYMYNNGIGSDPQSTNGLLLDVSTNKAEILDFSAAQDGSGLRVGCRDSSGNNYHAEIMNLPAGTLQERLDWANARLFVPYIS